MFNVFLSIMLAVLSAGLCHLCVRHCRGSRAWAVLLAALLCLGLSFYLGQAFGGLWAGIYTLLSVYFMACIVTPWLELWWERHRAG